MFFSASKILWLFLQPSSFIAIILLLGIVLSHLDRWRRAGLRVVILSLAALLIGGLSPLANLLMLPLENRVARATLDSVMPLAGIIILGGAENGRISLARDTMALNEAGERVTEAAVLANRFPLAKVIFSGGAGKMFREENSGAPSIASFLRAVGIAGDRILLEECSRNTHENAKFSRALLRPKPGERWLLVTSAFHMPRALGAFRQQGFDVLPWPVDYRTKDAGDLLRPFDSIAKGLKRLDVGMKEWIGLFVYRATGRTTALFPH